MTRAEQEFENQNGLYGWTPREYKMWLAGFKRRGELVEEIRQESVRMTKLQFYEKYGADSWEEAIRKLDE